MPSKSITIDHLEIAYSETNHDAKNTIFFIHGNSGSSSTWRKQLNDPLLTAYRMIAFDLPAHGNSSALADPNKDYNLPAIGKLMADAVDNLVKGGNFILAGFSLGSNVLAESLRWLRPKGVVLTGSSVAGGDYTMEKIFLPGVDNSVLFSDNASEESISNFAAYIYYASSDADKQLDIEEYHKVKAGFRPGFIKTVIEGKVSNEIELLQKADIPVLIIFGKDEKFANPDYLDALPFKTWNNEIFKLSKAGHAVHIDQPSIFNQLLSEYANDRMN